MIKIRRTQRGVIIRPKEYCMVHQLVRIKSDSSYLSLTGRLQSSMNEAILLHPEHAEHVIKQLQLRHKGRLFITESNRN